MTTAAAFRMPTWTGPMRRTKKYLHAHGWYVSRASQCLALWHLVALHPAQGVRLIYVHPPHGPGPEPPTLCTFECDPGWAKEVWYFPSSLREPRIRRVNGGPAPVSREDR